MLQPLLQPAVLFNSDDIATTRSLVPAERGIYGWWFDAALPDAPREGAIGFDGWHLLYVGIAPNGTSEKSVRNLRSRLRDHCAGQLARSTLRRTIATLLSEELRLDVYRNSRGKPIASPEGERLLTAWMGRHMRVAWLTHTTPWEIESDLVGQGLFPLNVAGSTHPFSAILKQRRSLLGR
jgi:hypothetical protein